MNGGYLYRHTYSRPPQANTATENWLICIPCNCRCEPERKPLKVAMLLSGGVDSSVALHLLKAAGHNVTAFYLQIWFQEDFRNTWDSCPWEEDLEYCTMVCERLGVTLKVVPLTTAYWEYVVKHSIDEVKSGRTPNPDILCNSRVKFGAFYEYLNGLKGEEFFDRVASGHYAKVMRRDGPLTGMTSPDDVRLLTTPDDVKDQTYFLAHLSRHQLRKAMFPLGSLTKQQVRALAQIAELPNKERRDSQGICFLGKVKFDEFVKEHLGEWPGPLVEEESQEVVGYHQGYWFYTIGQRKGIHLSEGPWYVTRKDTKMNAVYISKNYHEVESQKSNRSRTSFICSDISWVSDARPTGENLFCKVRHGPKMYKCTLMPLVHGETSNASGPQHGESMALSRKYRVDLDGVDQGLAAGQYAVFYQDGTTCLGCATIQ